MYRSVALSRDCLCDFESIGIGFVLLLHDELDCVSLHVAAVTDEDMKHGID